MKKKAMVVVVALAAATLLTTPAQSQTTGRDQISTHPLRSTPQFDTGNVTNLQPGPNQSVFVGGIKGFPGLYQVQGDQIVWRVEPLRAGVNGLTYKWGDLFVATGSTVIRYNPPSTTPVWRVDLGKKVNDVSWVRSGRHTRILAAGDFNRRFRLLGPGGGIARSYDFPTVRGNINEFAGPVGIAKMAVSPDHHRIISIGNFKRVNGTSRARAFSMYMGPRRAALQRWYIPELRKDCGKHSPVFLRDIKFSHRGDRVAMDGKGGYGPLCDALVVTSSNPRNANLNYIKTRTCVDSFMSLSWSPDDRSILAQGHFKNMERRPGGKPCGGDPNDFAPRYGIGMVRSSDMHLRAWKSDKCRSEGGLATEWLSYGAWVGYDCGFWGNSEGRNPDPSPQFARARLAFLPRAG